MTAFLSPCSSRVSTAAIVVPPGEHTISFSSPGCLPVSRTILAAPYTDWAAGLEYYYKKQNDIAATQSAIAKEYGVSTSTLAKRNKEISAVFSD